MKDTVDRPEGAPRWTASPVSVHAVQCARCLKWRVVPSKQHYEEIREHILEQPWMCENASKWGSDTHCGLPADIEQDKSMLWAIDKPNLPCAPKGWERQITVRTDGSSKFADVYYTTPVGTRLRSKIEIEKYIAEHPDSVPPETTMDQFSFAIPRPLPGVCPQLSASGGKLASAFSSRVASEETLGQLASYPADSGKLASHSNPHVVSQETMDQGGIHPAVKGELPSPSNFHGVSEDLVEETASQPADMSDAEDLPPSPPLPIMSNEDAILLDLADEGTQQSQQVDFVNQPRMEYRPFSSVQDPHQVTPISPQRTEYVPFSSKRWHSDLATSSYKRTKEQIKRNRLGMEAPLGPNYEQVGASTSDVTEVRI